MWDNDVKIVESARADLEEQRLAAQPAADQQHAEQEVDCGRLDLDELFILQPDGQPAEPHDQCSREDQHRADMPHIFFQNNLSFTLPLY